MPQQAQFSDVTGSGDASDDLIYHITHDLRAPIRALSLLPDWIEEDFTEGGTRMPRVVGEHLNTIREQTRALDQMILDLRDFSRVGRLADTPSTVDLEPLLHEIASELPKTPQLDLDLDLCLNTIFGPRNDLKALFKALLANCLQHHDRDRARVLVASEEVEETLSVSVIDDGPGIAKEYRERAFELMTTLYRRDDGAGSGVGLAVAKRVVENLNGTIEIVDTPTGRGTNVRMMLPNEHAEPVPTSPESPQGIR